MREKGTTERNMDRTRNINHTQLIVEAQVDGDTLMNYNDNIKLPSSRPSQGATRSR